MQVYCFAQVKNYIFTNLTQCAQKMYKPLSNARENFTIQKVKSFFQSKIKQIKSSEFYSRLKDLYSSELVGHAIALVCIIAIALLLMFFPL